MLSPDADAPPMGRQILRLRSRKCYGGREEEKKEPGGAREEALESAKRKGYPQTMLEF